MSSNHSYILQGFSSYFELFHSHHNLEGTTVRKCTHRGNTTCPRFLANTLRGGDHSQSLQGAKLRWPVLCHGMNPSCCLPGVPLSSCGCSGHTWNVIEKVFWGQGHGLNDVHRSWPSDGFLVILKVHSGPLWKESHLQEAGIGLCFLLTQLHMLEKGIKGRNWWSVCFFMKNLLLVNWQPSPELSPWWLRW